VGVVAVGKEPDPVRSLPLRPSSAVVRRQLERLVALPLRPASVRSVLGTLAEDEPEPQDPADLAKSSSVTELDPGWALAQSTAGGELDALWVITERPWWPAPGGACGDALGRLWRHAVAVSQAARRLAREANDPDPEKVARAGLLHGVGHWAMAAVDPEFLPTWLAEADLRARVELEESRFETDLSSLGRLLAERWGCEPLVVDAAWLHADATRSLSGCASDPARLALIQEAYDWAEQTPWALGNRVPRDPHAPDSRLRLLIAEVQVRCTGPFLDPDANAHEEQLSRAHARLRRKLGRLQAASQARDRFLAVLAASEPTDSPDAWAERAGLWWCGEPGVAAARVVWTGAPVGAPATAQRTTGAGDDRPPSIVLPLGTRARPGAEVHLWTLPGAEASPAGAGLDPELALGAWRAWARLVGERARLAGVLDRVVQIHREMVASEELRLRQAKLDALAEFAAGAGHELNNPLAVIVGRAQLLLGRETDPAAIRSLRAILTQAQRAHRILRDLMYVARPPEPRPRFCQPEEIIRTCLRDLKDCSDDRGVRLLAETRAPEAKVWADPDVLRHLADVLLRNALEATPQGGTIQIVATTTAPAPGSSPALSWTVQDNGRGISAVEGAHVFDPFYCGRQAGRGLGLGLPRAARALAQAGGEIRWHAGPGQGTIFQVHLPLTEPPQAPAELAAAGSTLPRDDSHPPAV
jgi:signal transduction histidine kinase